MKILVYKTELTMLMTISYAILEYNAASEMQTLEKEDLDANLGLLL